MTTKAVHIKPIVMNPGNIAHAEWAPYTVGRTYEFHAMHEDVVTVNDQGAPHYFAQFGATCANGLKVDDHFVQLDESGEAPKLITIVGCTQAGIRHHNRELPKAQQDYVKVGNVYEVLGCAADDHAISIKGEDGGGLVVLYNLPNNCPHLPKGARWVAVKR